MNRAPIVNIDMDDVTADFSNSASHPITGKTIESLMWNPNFFYDLKPVSGAKAAVLDLIRMGYDVWILSQPLAECPESYIDKVRWINYHFPQLYKKIIFTQNKGLHIGEYLIDDNLKWKEPFEKNGGKFIHFKYGNYNGHRSKWNDPEMSWELIVQHLRTEINKRDE